MESKRTTDQGDRADDQDRQNRTQKNSREELHLFLKRASETFLSPTLKLSHSARRVGRLGRPVRPLAHRVPAVPPPESRTSSRCPHSTRRWRTTRSRRPTFL